MWSIWGTNVWKCFPICTEGGGICKLLLPHGPSSLPHSHCNEARRVPHLPRGRCHGPPTPRDARGGGGVRHTTRHTATQRHAPAPGPAGEAQPGGGGRSNNTPVPPPPPPPPPSRTGTGMRSPLRAPPFPVPPLPAPRRSLCRSGPGPIKKNKNISIKGYNDHY